MTLLDNPFTLQCFVSVAWSRSVSYCHYVSEDRLTSFVIRNATKNQVRLKIWQSFYFVDYSVLLFWIPSKTRNLFILRTAAAAAAKSLQSCPTLCDPIDGSPPSSPIPGILQARTLEWVAISSSNAWKWKVKVKSLSCIQLLATPWTAAHQAPPSMGFSRQEYWSGVPLPSLILWTTSALKLLM